MPVQAVRPARHGNGYGTYAVTAAGAWTYTLDNTNAAVQALNVGSAPLTDTFTVFTEDGTAQLVTITITGTNDAAIITGTATGRSIEAGVVPGTPTATGDLLATDVDNAGGCVPGGCGRRGDDQRLRHLRGDGGGGVDLHARQHQCDGAGAQRIEPRR